jgi:hypothetical protein
VRADELRNTLGIAIVAYKASRAPAAIIDAPLKG